MIFELYMDRNVRPKFVKTKFIIDFPIFTGLMPSCSLVKDLRFAFHTKVVQDQELKELITI